MAALPPVMPEDVHLLVAASVFVALAAVLLYLDFNSRVHRAFALFLGLRAAVNLLVPYNNAPETFDFWLRTSTYLTLALPFATLYFVVAELEARRRSPALRWLGRGLLAAGAAVELLYILHHPLALDTAGVGRGPLWTLSALRVGCYVLAAVLLLRAYAAAGAKPGRSSLLIMALGFALYPLDYTLSRTLFGIHGWETAVELALLALLGGQLAHLALRGGDAGQRAEVRRWLPLPAAAAATGMATALLWAPPSSDSLATVLFDGLWTLAFGVLVTYALLRHQLFDIDLRVKGAIKQSTVVAAFVGVYLVAAQVTQAVLGEAAPYVGIGVAALLGLFMAPLQRVADRVANAAMPHVSGSPGYLSFRKLEVYRAAAEQELAAGQAGLASPRLAAMRADLGLTDRDHAILLHAMRAEADVAVADGMKPGDLVLGRYHVDGFLAEGAHGRTFLAVDTQEGGKVVVKALRPERASESQLLREARALAAVRHPNVVRLLEVAKDRGQVVLVLEFVDGGALRARLEQGPVQGAAFHRLATGLLAGLGAVHAGGAVHRDVKPSNVLLTRDGTPKLADFGIAHLPGAETTIGPKDAGTAIGTIRYMSPEQAKGRKVTARSDLFSAAATLYEAHTGQPYLPSKPGESPIELQMRAAAAGSFKRPVEGAPTLRAWFARGLDPDPARRFGSAEEMLAALGRALPERARAAQETS